MKRTLSVVFILLICIFSLFACNKVVFNINFVVDGENYATVTTAGNEIVQIPENPIKDGYTFCGWYWDDGKWEKPFTANSLLDATLSADMKVYAKWNCNHISSEWETVADPTCESLGTRHLECTICSEILEIEEIPALEHDEILHEAKAPTCTEIGWDACVTCSRCEYTTYAEKAALGHTEGAAVEENRVEATCENNGSYDSVIYCSVCETELSREAKTIPALNHNEVSHEAKAPTCTEIGWDVYVTCSRCEYTTYAEKSALGHTEGAAVEEKRVEATCENNGSYDSVIYCSTCKTELSRETKSIAALGGHTEVTEKAKEPTCTETGLTAGMHCSVCDSVIVAQKVIPANGHSFGNWQTIKAPSEAENGEKRRDCENCDAYETDIIAPLSHDHTRWPEIALNKLAPTCTETGLTEGKKCSGCGETLIAQQAMPALGHDEINHEAKAPTCTEIGFDAYVTCSRCEYTTYAEKAALGHIEAAAVEENRVEASCTVDGSYDYVVYCSVCKTELSREAKTIEALGHDEIAHEAQAPTCTEIAWDAYVSCSRCDYTTYIEKAALGHTPGVAVEENRVEASCTTAGSYDSVIYCSVCKTELSRKTESKAALGHDEISHEAKDPTCTEIGWDAYVTCSRCEYTTYAEKAALGHIPGTAVEENRVEASCTTAGYYDSVIYCSVCKTELSRKTESIAALGHDEISHEAKDPTCTEIGLDAYVTCSRCDYTTYVEKPALNHSPKAAVEENRKEATCTQDGSYESVVYCSACDTELSRETKKITALGHNEQKHAAKAPTCTEIGWDAYVTCSRCDYTTYAEKSALGHSPNAAVEENRKEATCTADGSYDSVVYCSTCKAELSRTKKAIPTENLHSISGGECTWCGGKESTAGLKYSLNSDGKSYTVTGIGTCKETDIVIGIYNNRSVTDIGLLAFSDCRSLTSITIGNSVMNISEDAFYSCSALEKIYFNATAMNDLSYNNYTFANAGKGGEGISVVIGSNVTKIPAYLFGGNFSPKIINVEFEEDSVCESIGRNAFKDCDSLTTVTIPDSVTSIGSGAFYNCDNLTSITIPNSVTSIGSSAFYNCTSLTSITVGENNSAYKDIDGNLYSKDGTTLIQYAIGKKDTSFIIPDSVTTIGNYAFYGCDSLTSVTIPDSVTSIGDGAFSNCTSLNIYCEAASQPSGWSSSWNSSNRPVIWNYKDSGVDDDGYIITPPDNFT